MLSCSFEVDTCLWFNTGDFLWAEAESDQANDGQWYLLATGASGAFVMESLHFNETRTQKALLFAYQLKSWSSTSPTSLEMEYKTSAGWLTGAFEQTGDSGSSWKYAVVKVPEGTVGLRLLARLSAAEDAVKIDAMVVVDAVQVLADAACSFEDGFCGWSSYLDYWRRRTGDSGWETTGPDTAGFGDWYVHLDLINRFTRLLTVEEPY